MTNRIEFTHTSLHILAMFLMLLDHLWATLLPQYEILTCLGRIAFPIFAFLLVEGYTHTSYFKNYLKRMFIFALISEIPFNLMIVNGPIYPFHQNVMFTMCLGLLMVRLLDKLPKKYYLNIPLSILVLYLFYIIGLITFVDYHGAGLLMIGVFYLFRKRNALNILLTILLIYYINGVILGGYCYEFMIMGHRFVLVQQSLAILALIPIYLYKGKKGLSNKFIKYFNYAFYPVHMLIIYIIYNLVV